MGHYQAAKKQEKDPDGGSFPAYPSGKTWDEPSGKTGSGKKFFHNIIPGSAVATQEFYVDHYASDPLLHGWFADDCRWRMYQGWQGPPWFVRCWRGRWRCSRQQPSWWQLAPRLRGLRSRSWPRSVQVYFRRGRQIQDVPA